MKPEELQLGDIVTTTPSGMPIKVVAIHRKKVAYHACTDRFSWVRIGLLQPIPLTPEILEKNGFNISSLTDNRWTYGDIVLSKLNDYYVFSSIYDDYMIGTRPHIYYVHELQHALKLCGINKEIEL